MLAIAVDVTIGHTAQQLVSTINGASNADIQIVSTKVIGHPYCAGIFSDGKSAVPWFNDAGIVLSTGGPQSLHMQDSDAFTVCYATPGDADLNIISAPYPTHDACILEVEFTADPSIESIEFSFVFGSDEYLEFAGSSYTDALALYLNGLNVAKVPGTNTPVTINNLNQNVNSQYFHDNDPSNFDVVPYPNFEADGFTDSLLVSGPVIPGTNKLKFAIADAGDCGYDSWVLLEAGSLKAIKKATDAPEATDAPTETQADAPSGGANGDPHVKTWAGETFDFHGEYQCKVMYSL